MAMYESATIPDHMKDLLEGPLYGNLVTMRSDGAPQVSPWFFMSDGDTVKVTHVTDHQGYANLTGNPRVALSIMDPEVRGRYLEIRGEVIDVTPDPEGDFFIELAGKYGMAASKPLRGAEKRVVVTIRPVHTTSYPNPDEA